VQKCLVTNPEQVIDTARERAKHAKPESNGVSTQAALTFSKERNLEREAVVDERDLLRDAMRRSMGEATLEEVRNEFEKRVYAGEFTGVEPKPGSPERAFTTQEMIDYERDTIQVMRDGQNRHEPLVSHGTRKEIAGGHSHLNESQRKAVEQILASCDRMTALEGVAGAGKTTSLRAIREAAERQGYKVEGLAPTSRAGRSSRSPALRRAHCKGISQVMDQRMSHFGPTLKKQSR
jgi:AAA domain